MVLIVYIVLVADIMGRTDLVQYGGNGTFPYDWRSCALLSPAVCDHQAKFEPGSKIKLYYNNSWAMIWPSDFPLILANNPSLTKVVVWPWTHVSR